jgi:PAS domain S-box-containing protein
MDRADLEQWRPKEVARLLALVETERRYYQEIVANVPVGLLIVGSDLSILSANKFFRKFTGLRSDDILRRRLDEILPVSGLNDQVREVLASAKPRPRFAVRTMVAGRSLDFQLAIQPLQGWELEAGQEALLVLEDLSGLVPESAPAPSVVETTATAAEPAALAAPEPPPAVPPEPASAPEATVAPESAAPEPPEVDAIVWECDPETMRFHYVNQQGEELLGYPASRWLEEAGFWRERIHEEDRDRIAEFYRRASESGTSHACEYRALTARGETLWVRELVRVQRDEAGLATRFTGLTIDISNRRMAEEQAIQGQKVDALGRLAKQVAHDFNNLLMIIAGYSEELRNSLPVTSPLHNDMQEILRATSRVQSLTTQLQQYTKRLTLDPKPLDLNSLVRAIEPSLRRELGDGVELRVDVEADGAWVRADEAQIEQVVLTLARHAKFEMRGLGRLIVSTADMDVDEDYGPQGSTRPGSYVMVTVSDSGPGLDLDTKLKLFEPWLEADEAARDERLALAQAYNTVRQSGGDIAVFSEPGRGSSFRLFLPRVEAPAASWSTAPATGSPAETIPPPAEAIPPAIEAIPAAPEPELETILVVEDEAGIRALVRKILRRQGYQILEASQGEEALAVCAQHKGRIDLLVTDVMMPQMSGRELATKLIALRPDIKVLYVSGYTDDSMLQSGSFPPGTAFLQKPFTLGSLLGKVREVLDTRVLTTIQ